MRYAILLIFLQAALVSSAQLVYQRTDTIRVQKGGTDLLYPWAGGLNATQFEEMDINLDGIMDMMVFDKSTNYLLPFINNGIQDSVSYTYAPEYRKDFPEVIQWIRTGDYNCDGRMDIFSYAPGGMKVYKNTSGAQLSFELVEDLVYSFQPPNNINLYISSTDLPGIADVDGDGDLDVLTFGILGTGLQYHKNLSMETYGICDSLIFELKNSCWGGFIESSSDNSVLLSYQGWPCTTGNVSSPEFSGATWGDTLPKPQYDPGEAKHAGSTIMIFDMDSSGVMDLLLGDVSFNNLTMLQNGGAMVNTNSLMITQDASYPSTDTPVDLFLFPAGFYNDVNNDGRRDLIVTTNSPNLSEDKESVWMYLNEGSDLIPDPKFQTKKFLQGDMIETGTAAYPVFFDVDQDGLKDILIGNLGDFDTACVCYESGMTYYRNSGTALEPSFEWMTDDFESLSTSGLPIGIIPTFGDLDNDGDEDMMIGDSEGNVHYFENLAGAGSPVDFVLATALYPDMDGTTIDVGQFAAPAMVDLDRDNDLDLVIGARNGRLHYYENRGTVSNPLFKFVSDSLGYVDVRDFNQQQVNGSGFSVPTFIDSSGTYILYLGSESGRIFRYDDIDNNVMGTFTQTDTSYHDLFIGPRSGLSMADITGDGVDELIIGNYRGGLALFKLEIDNTGIDDLSSIQVQVFPNPASSQVIIRDGTHDIPYGTMLTVHDLSGKQVTAAQWRRDQLELNVANWPSGLYIGTWDRAGIQPFRLMIVR